MRLMRVCRSFRKRLMLGHPWDYLLLLGPDSLNLQQTKTSYISFQTFICMQTLRGIYFYTWVCMHDGIGTEGPIPTDDGLQFKTI